jgi:hypothetical protein
MTEIPSSQSLEDLEIGPDGLITTRPVLGWVTAPAMEMSVILRLNYAETPQELQTGGRHLQVILAPPQCLALADVLTRQARRILDAPRPQVNPS